MTGIGGEHDWGSNNCFSVFFMGLKPVFTFFKVFMTLFIALKSGRKVTSQIPRLRPGNKEKEVSLGIRETERKYNMKNANKLEKPKGTVVKSIITILEK